MLMMLDVPSLYLKPSNLDNSGALRAPPETEILPILCYTPPYTLTSLSRNEKFHTCRRSGLFILSTMQKAS